MMGVGKGAPLVARLKSPHLTSGHAAGGGYLTGANDPVRQAISCPAWSMAAWLGMRRYAERAGCKYAIAERWLGTARHAPL